MADMIQSLFIDPPIAVARLGASTVPQDAFLWVESPDPRMDGETTIMPTWSLDVQPDGSVTPRMPTDVKFRDGADIRPVCPFFELWAMVGEEGSAANTWRAVPVTQALLEADKAAAGVVDAGRQAEFTLSVDARNRKVARRTGIQAHEFGTRPPLVVTGSDHARHALEGIIPGPERRMIPSGRNIPLGSVQIMRPGINQPAAAWSGLVDLEVIRWRFTPARGLVYGPPQARTTSPPAVQAGNDFLDDRAGWFNAARSAVVAPSDTYNPRPGSTRSLGVVDDTCEARMQITLMLPRTGGQRVLFAFANAFSGPPHYGPDRRPFLSMADELNDRQADAAARTTAMTAADRDAWVADLFERIYETVSLFNVDFYRAIRGLTLTGSRLGPPLVNDGLEEPTLAMGRRDALRNPLYTVPAESPNERLPLSKHARRQHRAISDAQALRDFIALNPGRMERLVRAPFEIEAGEDGDNTTMRMPPFMRQSNAEALTLSAWQYDLLMQWVATANAAPPPPPAMPIGPPPPPPNVVADADERRDAVLARLDGGSPNP